VTVARNTVPPYRTAADATAALDDAYDRIVASDRPEVFLSLLSREDARASLAASYERPVGPLTGMIVAVKDNIDVDGFDTTAACPGYRYTPDEDAASVAALRAAGATIIGKTNLDQFATGLVGTRSPYGEVRDSRVPERISGGSSSGSSVAVALGFVDAALGTDTAGSGRVPAGLQGIVGIKPTLGVVSTRGVVPACASYDCVTVFARHTVTAEKVMAVLATTGERDGGADVRFAAPVSPVVGVPADLPELSASWRAAFLSAVDGLRAAGCEVRTIDLGPALDAAKMLYESPVVAERAEAVGAFVGASAPEDGVDPTVSSIVTAAGRFSGPEVLAARRDLDRRRADITAGWADLDAVLIPTAPFHPTIAEVTADPVGVNAAMGTYTNFCNLFDLCGIAVPWTTVPDGGLGDAVPAQFGVTVLAPAFGDAVAADIAARLGSPDALERARDATSASAPGSWMRATRVEYTSVVVVGAHLRGQPLNGQLAAVGAVFVGDVETSSNYRLFALNTIPPKPGMTGPVAQGGAGIAGEEWVLSPAGMARFLDQLPAPMALGEITLSDGRHVTGFTCQPGAVADATEITATGGWRTYLAAAQR
jgi:allophanate hydrolase